MINFEEGIRILDTAVFQKINRYLTDVERIILEGSWQGLTYEEIADTTNNRYTAEHLRQFVGFNLWRLLSEVLEEKVSKTNFIGAVERLYYRHQNITPAVNQDRAITDTNEFAPECPDDPVPLNSLFYIERSPIKERLCYTTILQPGSLIRIKAPHKMGKTSLLNRIIAHSSQQGYRTVRINFRQLEAADFSSLDKFLRWFCDCVSLKLRLPSLLNETWTEYRNSIGNCTVYFEDNILDQINNNLVLALDEVDIVFRYHEISQCFFAMLRTWHEEAKTLEIWEKLRLIVVHSTEDYGSLDINRSPFDNVGLVIPLPEFTLEQVKNLIQHHKLNYNETQVQQLMSLIGGHPYLIRLALYHLAFGENTLDNF